LAQEVNGERHETFNFGISRSKIEITRDEGQ